MLTLLCGIAHSRLGRLDVGQQWAMVAQLRARMLRDRPLEVRALNVCGAIALEGGGINEATYFFTRAQEEAMRDDDMATAGRCANNLGIIANMQGDYVRAVGAYTRAIAAYQKANYERGIVETQHNLGISYREQGQLDKAMEAADTAVREAGRLGDRRLQAQAIAGRAEIRVACAEPDLAIREAERALAMHRELKDAVLETEDRRILAVALSIAGKTQDAEQMLREVIDRATEHKRPLLVAIAQRDLAHILALQGEVAAAKQLAQAARAAFDRLGAKVEIEKLEALLAIPTSGASELDRSQPGSPPPPLNRDAGTRTRSEEHTSELQSLAYLVCRLLLEKKKKRLRSSHYLISYAVFCVKKKRLLHARVSAKPFPVSLRSYRLFITSRRHCVSGSPHPLNY